MTNINECPDCCGDGVIKTECQRCRGSGQILPIPRLECTSCNDGSHIAISSEISKWLRGHNRKFKVVYSKNESKEFKENIT